MIECRNTDPSSDFLTTARERGYTVYLVRSRAGARNSYEAFPVQDVTAMTLAARSWGGVPCTIHTAERCPPPNALVIVWRAPIASTCL